MLKRSPGLGLFPETNYELMLRESVKMFLAGVHRESFDFDGFRSVMYRQLHSKTDTPLEIVWLYSAANYHERIAAKDPFDRTRGVRELLQLISALSSACGPTKSIALIAPVVYELHQCAVAGGPMAKKAMKEIERLANEILCYISICSGRYSDSQGVSAGLPPCFLDLVKAWTLSNSASVDSLEAFFPLVNNKVLMRLEVKECGLDYLAGVVIYEVFLLMLCLKVKGGGASCKDLQNDLRTWAVSSITLFNNQHFFEILLKLLLDPKVAATTLMNAEDEKVVRGVLYDAVILVEYSFLFCGKEMDWHYRMKNLLVEKLIVTNEAIKIARAKGDQGKAASYINAFSTSSLPHELIKWVSKEIGNASEKPHNSSPQGYLKWLVQLQQVGLRVFDDETLQFASESMFDEYAAPMAELQYADAKKVDADLFFFDRGESNDVAMQSAVFSSKGAAKRKEAAVEDEKRFKFVKV